MILLTSTSDLIKVVTGSSFNVDVHVSYMDYNGTIVTPGRTNTLITTATTTTVLVSPGSSVQRNVKGLTVYNRDATNANLITVQHYDGTNTVDLYQYNLSPGNSIQYFDTTGFMV